MKVREKQKTFEAIQITKENIAHLFDFDPSIRDIAKKEDGLFSIAKVAYILNGVCGESVLDCYTEVRISDWAIKEDNKGVVFMADRHFKEKYEEVK